jgi:hypothetical protein
MFTFSAKPAPASPRHLNVECAACGRGYAVNPHQGGTFLRRHAQGKHPNAWAWWTQRVRELEAEEASGRLLREDAEATTPRRAKPTTKGTPPPGGSNAGGGGPGGSSSHHPAASASEVDPADDPISAFAEARSDPIGAPVRGSSAADGSPKRRKTLASSGWPPTPSEGGEKDARGGQGHPTHTLPGGERERVFGDKSAGGRGNALPAAQKHSSLMRLDPTRVGAGGVALLCADCEPCELRASRFFVAWSGVLTLAWEGFPPAVAALKRKIARAFPALPEEKPGSRWAKTTLGCLKDGARLTPEALATLAEVCEKHRDALVRGDPSPRRGDRETPSDSHLATNAPPPGRAPPGLASGDERPRDPGTSGTNPDTSPPPSAERASTQKKNPSRSEEKEKGGSASGGRVPVDHLSVVVFQCRSLERTVSEHVVALGPGPRSRDPPAAAEREAVERVTRAFRARADCEGYYFDAARDGSREAHYRDAAFGATLVARVGPGKMPGAVDAFRREVDERLPGLYVWFEDESLHCTVRGLAESQ